MKDLSERIAALSPEQRALLERRFQSKGLNQLKPPLISNSQPNSETGILSYAQERLWLLHQLQPDCPLYNEISLFKLRGCLNLTALEQSFNQVLQRHEILRSQFVAKDGKPVTQITPHRWITLPVVDIEQEANAEARAMQLATEEAQKPFDLSEYPLFRLKLYRLSEQQYLWLMVVHHIICDGWSMGIFIREIATLYADFQAKKSPSLPELSIQYADFAWWEKQQSDRIFATQLEYWKQKLSGSLPYLEIPTLNQQINHSKVNSCRGARKSIVLSSQLSQALKTLSQKQNVTLFMLLLAAFKVLLSRYTALEDILVGSPIANRNRPELEDAIGLFVNTLVLRSDLSGDPTFAELLQQVKQVALEAYSNQDLPFEKIVAHLQPERNLSQSPLFQVMFILYNLPNSDLELPGLTVAEVPLAHGMAKLALTLEIRDRGSSLEACFEYNSDRFGVAQIERMLLHYQTLLENVVVNPDLHLSQIDLLTAAEKQQLLVEWNNTEVKYPQDKCIHQLFEAQVEKTPDAVAVIFENQQLTYRELNTRANQLAHHLQKLGVKPEVIVGICLERSLELVIGLLAILKAGGAYLPLDPSYPRDRLAFMLENSQTSILITQRQIEQNLPPHQAQVIFLEQKQPIKTKESIANPICNLHIDNLAYVIYTSGSTGKPKGAMNTHRGILNRLLWMQEAYQLTTEDSVLQKTPFSFDVSVWEFFWCLMVGARLIIAKPEGHRDRNYLINLIKEQQITTIHFVPSMLQIFLEAEGLEHCQSLKRVICSGEALSFALQEKFFARLNCELYNLYGPTEAAIDVTHWRCQKNSSLSIVPIGRPIANIQIYILDRDLQTVPIGVAGELHIGGVGLARGYLNQPQLTEEKFIPNPFTVTSHQLSGVNLSNLTPILYKTGDLARYHGDGIIEYLGRIDHQVKIRGFRIELGEIEVVIASYPLVKDCVVVAYQDTTGDTRLVAYYISEAKLDIKQLRDFLKSKLPDYMIPSAFVELEAFPLTPNGKCDRNSLPIPDFTPTTSQYLAPRNATEKTLATIWQEVLHLPQVGIDDNFFELGGHSLLATQVVSKIRQSLSVELALRCLFEYPTIAQLANQMETIHTGVALPPIKPVARERDLPLSFAQQRLWFLAQLETESYAYNGSSILELQGELNLEALTASINEIVRRHEVLRTSFTMVDGQPKQKIAPELKINLASADLHKLSPTELDTEIKQLTQVYTQQVFDLSQAPLFRLNLFQLQTNQHLLLITMHHIISDAWSTGVFIRELSALYTAFVNNQPNPLPELAIQYADFAVWQRQLLQGEFLATQLNYWERQLGHNLPVLNLPTTRPRQEVTTNPSAKETFLIPVELSQAIEQLSRREGVSLFMTVLAVLQVLLQRYTNQDDIVVGTDVANRNCSEIEPLIGFFVNLLVLRTDLSGNPTFTELLQRVRQVTLGAYAHQDLPFDRLVKALQPQRYLSYTPPLFQVLLVMQNTPMPVFELPGLSLKLREVEDTTTRFDLALFLKETEAGIEGEWQYNADLFTQTTIISLSTHFQNLLNSVTETPDARINNVKMLSDQELEELNQTKQRKKFSKLNKFNAIKQKY
ncbi:amino acid adenylation domain protein [Stanieria cyanosphaera PCC 7437]|uniref:Amino acid adenylation domain protein n=1 Tax=Stanieria cyanosphaera (strain ATCC 29371 / PCC 7437) TaxID=111780 RepID=K9XUI8_STAC7|nr:non-ribosomal peptide synthetase [Stanieria cyanosphaera]AFZ36198.1 amino acid adenylation domain protein [Stanieria cyanosphaera PCC 7437]